MKAQSTRLPSADDAQCELRRATALVSNFQTLDGYYESTNRTFEGLFDYYLEDYGNNEAFEEYNNELLRDADALLLSGRTSFMANKDYWVSYPNTIAPEDLAPWQDTTSIIRGADLYA